MAFTTDLANLDHVRIVTHTRGFAATAEYQADLMIPGETDGTSVSLLRLNHFTPEELRKFAAAIEQVAYDTEHQYDED